MIYRVIILPPAKRNLRRYIRYTSLILQNKDAAISIRDDVRETKIRLSKNADIFPLCPNPTLAELGYRKISFKKHDFFMLYRIEGNKVIVESMYHELQDYESAFLKHLHCSDEEEIE